MTPAQIERAANIIRERLEGYDDSFWPETVAGADVTYARAKALDDLLDWIRKDEDRDAYKRFRARIITLHSDKNWKLEQFRTALQLPPGLIERIRSTGHDSDYDLSLRLDFIRHLSKLP